MKVYRDLIVKGNAQSLTNFVESLRRHLVNGWSWCREREAEVQRSALGRMYCFTCTANNARPISELWMATNSEGYLYVSNILARELSSLTYDQYNAILSDFHDNCINPSATGTGVSIELGNPDPQLEDFLSQPTARLLRSFSSLANRSVTHTLDRRRWNEFLIAVHKEGAHLDVSMLRRWLTEEEKWPPDEAADLAGDYARAMDLLKTYESLPA